MKIEEFLRNSLEQIFDSCAPFSHTVPNKINFTLKINEDGNICKPADFVAVTIEVEISRDRNA